MTVPDEGNATPRWEALRATLDSARGALQAIGNDVEVKRMPSMPSPIR